MREQILEKDFNQAVEELRVFLEIMAKAAELRGWTYYATSDAPESYKDLKAMTKNKCIPIADYGSDTSIYGKDINTLFRFYHDVTHLEQDWPFSEKGETLTVEKHRQDGIEYGLSPLALRILWADTYGQVRYYYRNKRFVNNQLDFVWMCLQVGIGKACSIEV